MHWNELLLETTLHALVISAFVLMMMVVVEYANILLRGRLTSKVGRGVFAQSFFAGLLGCVPGCVGNFANVALYEHGVLSFGALVAGMIAGTGDEAFVMMSLFPGKFALLTLVLFVIGVAVGMAVDLCRKRRFVYEGDECDALAYHGVEGEGRAGVLEQLKDNLRFKNVGRWSVLVCLVIFFVLTAKGVITPHGHENVEAHFNEDWVSYALMAVIALAIAVTMISSDHFIKEHIVGHVVKRHLPSVFLWIFGVLLLVKTAGNFIDVGSFIHANCWWVLLVACLVGLIPQSGPQLLFVALFADGAIPFSILLANSIVQDGHGGLPLLAFSRKDFLAVKAVNFLVALAVSAVLMMAGR